MDVVCLYSAQVPINQVAAPVKIHFTELTENRMREMVSGTLNKGKPRKKKRTRTKK